MSFLIAAPEFLSAAASDLSNLGSTLSEANAAAALPTSGLLPAGADEVSASIAALFAAHGRAYQTLSAQAATFHSQFVQLMNGGAASYASTEAANAEQAMLHAVNAPTQALVGTSADRQRRRRGAGAERRRRRDIDRQWWQRRTRHRDPGRW